MMKTLIKKKSMKHHSFTLIELLIVIGLLGALVSVILPSFTGARHDALHLLCDYNQAGTARTLMQYRDLYNQLPDGMHTGIDVEDLASAPANAEDLMDMPSEMVENFLEGDDGSPSFKNLSQANQHSLNRVGINNLAWGSGYNLVDVSGGVRNGEGGSGIFVAVVTDDWEEEGGDPITFRGRAPSDLTDGGDDEAIIVLFITPTVDWESGPNNREIDDWTMGEIQLRVDLEGKCPIPHEQDFRYYAAYVRVFGHDSSCGGRTRAQVVGVSCAECGVLNP